MGLDFSGRVLLCICKVDLAPNTTYINQPTNKNQVRGDMGTVMENHGLRWWKVTVILYIDTLNFNITITILDKLL